jgi:UDP-hydrolysing UDP-N-acetyl-D-glucosamine 2-epimerase
VVTGGRSEFGLLDPVMRAIGEQRSTHKNAKCKLQLRTVVAGTHLTAGTWRDVRDAGFRIDSKVSMQRRAAVGRDADVASLGRGVIGLGKAFATLKPDVVLVLGDRIEALAAACAASVGGIHLAHIHGGDRACGVADEAMRHAISKLAHLHFAATANSRKRLVRMGELPAFVFNVGSPSADGLRDVEPADEGPELIVIQHPIGASDADERRWMLDTLRATDGFDRLALAPNSDPGCRGIRSALRAGRCRVVDHLPRGRFLSLLAGAKAIIGNSSAGLIEAAVLKRPCINVGPRQAGREKPASVVDCDYGQRAVRGAIRQALSLDLGRLRHPYGDGHTGERIADMLAGIDLTGVPIRKHNVY